MAALANLPSEQGIAAMQSINVAVINRWFLSIFCGTGALLVALITILLVHKPSNAARILAGSALYLVGTIGVTMIRNVPLNTELKAATSTDARGRDFWTRYLSVWTSWNHVRTCAAFMGSGALTLALALR